MGVEIASNPPARPSSPAAKANAPLSRSAAQRHPLRRNPGAREDIDALVRKRLLDPANRDEGEATHFTKTTAPESGRTKATCHVRRVVTGNAALRALR